MGALVPKTDGQEGLQRITSDSSEFAPALLRNYLAKVKAEIIAQLSKLDVDARKGDVQSLCKAAFEGIVQQSLGQLSSDMFEAALKETQQHTQSTEQTIELKNNKRWELRFSHKCEGQGCSDLECKLCKHNPYKRCRDHFAQKYLVGDTLTAKCGAPICVEVVHAGTGAPATEGFGDAQLEMYLLNGGAKGVDDGTDTSNFDDISLLDNNKGMPLLVSGSGGRHDSKHKVLAALSRGTMQLPSLQVTDSSEAMLPGRKSTFRLLVTVIDVDGQTLKPLVSPPFVVATRRIKGNIKEDFPTVDDPVGKLEHIGKQTEEKLRDLKVAARNCNVELHLPYKYTLEGGKVSIQTVGQFRQLMKDAEMDTHLRKQLMQVLKMNAEQWQRAYEHAMRAVDVDNRLRKWYTSDCTCDTGLVFPCKLGKIDLTRPVGLLQSSGAAETVTVMDQLTYGQRELVSTLIPQAVEAWNLPSHQGWDVCDVDYEQFLKSGTLQPAPNQMGAGAGGPNPHGASTNPDQSTTSSNGKQVLVQEAPAASAPSGAANKSPFAADEDCPPAASPSPAPPPPAPSSQPQATATVPAVDMQVPNQYQQFFSSLLTQNAELQAPATSMPNFGNASMFSEFARMLGSNASSGNTNNNSNKRPAEEAKDTSNQSAATATATMQTTEAANKKAKTERAPQAEVPNFEQTTSAEVLMQLLAGAGANSFGASPSLNLLTYGTPNLGLGPPLGQADGSWTNNSLLQLLSGTFTNSISNSIEGFLHSDNQDTPAEKRDQQGSS